VTGGGGKITQDLGVSYDVTPADADPGLTTQFLRKDGVYAIPSSGLSGTVTIAEGGTGETTQAAALTALTGSQTAGYVVRSDGTNSALAALEAGDLPSLSTTFTFGSTGAVPSSGTYAAGTVLSDQNGVLRVCTVGGSPGTWARVFAQPWQFFVDDYGAKGDGVKCLVTVSTSSATITAAADVFTSTAVDGGKNIMICGGGGDIPGGPAIDTIDTITDSTHAVLTSGAPGGPDGSGLACVFSSDDRVAIDNCMTAAATYAMAHSYFAQVIFSDKIYGLGANLFQSEEGSDGATLTYNTQVRWPVPTDQTGESGSKLEIQLIGAGSGGNCQFWMATNLNIPGTALVSYSVGPNSASGTYGQQSIVGGPSAGSGTVTGDNGFFNAKAVVEGISLVQPGWSNSIGLDLQWIAACRLDGITSTAFAPSGDGGGGVNPYNEWIFQSFWLNNKIAIGFRLPNQENNDELYIGSLNVQGLNTGIYSEADHVLIRRLSVNSLNTVIKVVPGENAHAFNVDQISWENCNGCIATDGGSSAKLECNITLDGENTVISGDDVSDGGNELYGVLYWSDQFRTGASPAVSGAGNLKIVNNMLGPGPMASPPSAPSSTDASTPLYRDALWYVSASGGITVVVLTDAADNSFTTGQTAGDNAVIPVDVPSGSTFTPTYSGTMTVHGVTLK
jgi:hypothetical protein